MLFSFGTDDKAQEWRFNLSHPYLKSDLDSLEKGDGMQFYLRKENGKLSRLLWFITEARKELPNGRTRLFGKDSNDLHKVIVEYGTDSSANDNYVFIG